MVDEILNQTMTSIKSHDGMMPYVTLTYAQSMDGCIAHVKGKPTKISNDKSMSFTHSLRAIHHGILVGIGTVISDNPSLSVRYGQLKNNHPVPIVVDSTLKCPLNCKLVNNVEKRRPLIILSTRPIDDTIGYMKRKAALENAGVEIIECCEDSSKTGRVCIRDGLQALKTSKGIQSVMVEGGSSIISSCIETPSFVNQIILTIAPVYVSNPLLFCNIIIRCSLVESRV